MSKGRKLCTSILSGTPLKQLSIKDKKSSPMGTQSCVTPGANPGVARVPTMGPLFCVCEKGYGPGAVFARTRASPASSGTGSPVKRVPVAKNGILPPAIKSVLSRGSREEKGYASTGYCGGGVKASKTVQPPPSQVSPNAPNGSEKRARGSIAGKNPGTKTEADALRLFSVSSHTAFTALARLLGESANGTVSVASGTALSKPARRLASESQVLLMAKNRVRARICCICTKFCHVEDCEKAWGRKFKRSGVPSLAAHMLLKFVRWPRGGRGIGLGLGPGPTNGGGLREFVAGMESVPKASPHKPSWISSAKNLM